MRVVSDTTLLVALVFPPNLSRSTSPTVVPSRCNTNSVSCFNGPSVNRFGIIRPVLHFVIPSSKQEVHYSQFYIGTEVLLLNTFFRTMTSIFSASFLLPRKHVLVHYNTKAHAFSNNYIPFISQQCITCNAMSCPFLFGSTSSYSLMVLTLKAFLSSSYPMICSFENGRVFTNICSNQPNPVVAIFR